MAFVSGYDYDIFISYAHVDNEPHGRDGDRWVTEFERSLRAELGMQIGTRECAIYFDNIELRGNHSIPGISDKVRRSAMLLVILSNGYLSSQFCMNDELDVFLKERAADEENIYVVRKSPIHGDVKEREPDALHRLNGCQFWQENRERRTLTLGMHTPRNEEYHTKLFAAAEDMAHMLRALKVRASSTVSRDSRASAGGSVVLLAEVTDDLEDQREQVRLYLEQFGIDSRPAAPYPRPGLAAAFDKDLAGCCGFVQLLSRVAGRRDEHEAPRGYAWLQYERAAAAGLPIFQWCSPELDLDSASGDQRELLALETVQQTSLTDFQREIRQQILAPPTLADVADSAQPQSIYIDHDLRDEAHAEYLQNTLTGDYDVFRTPRFPDDVEALRLARERLMRDSESVIFLYGSADQKWVDGELNEFIKIRPSRSKPPKKQVVFVAPPPPLPPDVKSPSVQPRGTDIVTAHDGIDESAVDQLKNLLKS